MPRLPVPDAELHVTVTGEGAPVLLVHDASASSAAWARHVDALAAAGHLVVAFDARGHGASTPLDGRALTMDALVSDARAVLDAFAPGRAHVVGHGVGGAVAAWVAYWEGVARVASLAVAACPPEPGEAYRAHHHRALEAEAPEGLRRAVLELLARVPDDDWPGDVLTQYKGAALVAEAGRDPLYSPAHTMFWRAWLPGARVERIEAGHEFPVDGGDGEAWFRERLLAHLREASA